MKFGIMKLAVVCVLFSLTVLGQEETRMFVVELKWKVAEEVVSLIEPMLSNEGNVVADPRTNKLIIWDTTSKVWEIERALSRLDKNDMEHPVTGRKIDILLEGSLKDAEGRILSNFTLRTPPGYEAMHQEIEELAYKSGTVDDKVGFVETGLRVWLRPEITMDDNYALRARLWVGELAGKDTAGKPVIAEFSQVTGKKFSMGETHQLEFSEEGKLRFTCSVTMKPFRTQGAMSASSKIY